ncbi:MAG: hemin uptake protein HemP [Vitreoscilla sp.]|nr:hemin uptake protein HemP [Polaromonas sp.]
MTQSGPLTSSQQNLSLPVRAGAIQPYLSSDAILRGQKVVEINHNGSTYKLQATRLGKLILTK